MQCGLVSVHSICYQAVTQMTDVVGRFRSKDPPLSVLQVRDVGEPQSRISLSHTFLTGQNRYVYSLH